jgi:hypothetical protein
VSGRPRKLHRKMAEVRIDRADAHLLDDYGWNVVQDRRRWYVQRMNKDTHRIERLHRTIMGVTDPKTQVDHKDGNGLNNSRSNLRLCGASGNQMNRGPTRSNTSGYKGVSWVKRRGTWQAQITCQRAHYHLGFFDTPEAAHAAYKDAAVRLHGDFHRTKAAGDPVFNSSKELIPYEEAA